MGEKKMGVYGSIKYLRQEKEIEENRTRINTIIEREGIVLICKNNIVKNSTKN